MTEPKTKTVKQHNSQFTGCTEAFSAIHKNPSIPPQGYAEKLHTHAEYQALQGHLRHAVQSNHGYRPDSCSACSEIRKALEAANE